jgi:outer membrane receptor protein involved in Fe transport
VIVTGGPRKDDGGAVVTSKEAERIAGTQGDAGKSALLMPGVARSAFDSGALVVWGSAADDTKVYVDGVEIPRLFHGSAIRTVVPTELLQSVTLVPGGFGAEYGRGLGGVVKVKTAPLSLEEGTHGTIAADTLDGHALVARSFGEDVAVVVAGRYGWIDRLLPLVTSRDVSDSIVVPRYGDWQPKATFALGPREELSVAVLGARDELRRALPSVDPTAVRAEETTRDFHRVYLRYLHTLDDGAEVEATPFAGFDRDLYGASFGDVDTRLESRALVYGLRARHVFSLAREVALTVGLDALGTRSRLARRGSLTIPGREGDLTYFGQPPGEDVATDDFTVHSLGLAPYLEGRVELGSITLVPGARLEGLLLEPSRVTPRVGLTPEIGDTRFSTSIDPRVAAHARLGRGVILGASLGRYHQAPSPQDLSAVFGTPSLTWSSATHATASIAFAPIDGVSLELTGFYKRFSGLPVRTRAATPRLAFELVQDGEGRAYGGQLLARKKLARGFFAWISYTLSRSERRYLGDISYRPFDGDQPHVLAVVASQEIGAWTVGARFRYASGLPRTPIVGAYQDLRDDRSEPIFGAQNGTRLPAFYALDLRVEHAFALATSTRLVLSLDVTNATFHRNAEEIAYASDLKSHAYVTGLPTLAILGARLDF